ncbi:hypothetical protein DWY18_09765, partial [Bacteroides thetaiotaomicron]
MTTVLALVII